MGIYRAKEELTAISRQFGVKVIFFDGEVDRLPGGGKTHKFYASLGPKIENNEIQITVQGQTISSNFGLVIPADSREFIERRCDEPRI
jgi:phosphoenolpyruvate carboxylase